MNLVRYDVMIDRRADVVEEVRDELRSLAESVRDLEIEWESAEAFEGARDDARFRDFARVATIGHPDERGLDWVVEELVEAFGWKVDVTRQQSEESE